MVQEDQRLCTEPDTCGMVLEPLVRESVLSNPLRATTRQISASATMVVRTGTHTDAA
jgi:hypothetical protein